MRTAAARVAVAGLAVVQTILAVRVFHRLVQSARGRRIPAVAPLAEPGAIGVVIPVLDEEKRLPACLDGVLAHGPSVGEILVVDGGSRDATRDVVARYAETDTRVRLIAAAPVPAGWNGKAWGLESGRRALAPSTRWFLGLDADVRPTARLADALLAFAADERLDAFSVATRQRFADLGDAIVHPALLTTLVYRYGIPGNRMRTLEAVQANGQCLFARRDALDASDAFARARASRCEDVTTMRALLLAGKRVGFYESDDLVDTAMYASVWETLANWPRSLPMQDRYVRAGGVIGFLEVIFVQALPLPLLLAFALAPPRSTVGRTARALNGVLFLTRMGTLAGTARAYRSVPLAYWLSPVADAAAAVLLVASALRREHTWRGRRLVTGSSS